jgi:hypothetical protein
MCFLPHSFGIFPEGDRYKNSKTPVRVRKLAGKKGVATKKRNAAKQWFSGVAKKAVRTRRRNNKA